MQNKELVLGITLARAGSKGVPGKHLRKLAGKPLIDYTLQIIPNIELIDNYVVSTNCPEIQSHVQDLGFEAPFLRPERFSTDTASSVSALQHAVTFMEDKLGQTFSYIVEIMATNPFKDSNDVNFCISRLISEKLDAVIAVHRIFDHHPSRVKKIVDGMLVDFCVGEISESRRQDLSPAAYVRSGAIYALSRAMVMDYGLRYGTERCAAYVLPSPRTINIDSEEDFLLADMFLRRRNHV
jgi:CMP-N-acetylneuraminic acid synthetase